ncbi:MAG: hypothetical protein HY291_16265 [Planctomycetes bacterium]|nr:hypothetical protein [Planctomycetota bacterium]
MHWIPSSWGLEMKLTYCEKCGTLITELKPVARVSAEPVLCAGCKAGTSKSVDKKRRVSRDSGQIPRSKVSAALKMEGKKPQSQE